MNTTKIGAPIGNAEPDDSEDGPDGRGDCVDDGQDGLEEFTEGPARSEEQTEHGADHRREREAHEDTVERNPEIAPESRSGDKFAVFARPAMGSAGRRPGCLAKRSATPKAEARGAQAGVK